MSDISTIVFLGIERGFVKYHTPKVAFRYYKNHRVNLLTNQIENVGIVCFLDQLKKISNYDLQPKIITHLMYELGELDHVLECDNNIELALYFEYLECEKWSPKQFSDRPIFLSLMSKPKFEDYQRAFEIGYRHLQNGDCYQFNLTYKFLFSYRHRFGADDFVAHCFTKNHLVAAYAHATILKTEDKIYFSNSPECLFQISKNKPRSIWSMPIKGTERLPQRKMFNELWSRLVDSQKNQAELFMIADMVRNDLNKIDCPNVRVVASKKPLLVPGILHQYSLIAKPLSKKHSLYDFLRATFPGGSVTGAPKKRVIKILKEIEDGPRGFYCGSTVVWDSDQKIYASSINIRSAVIDLNNSVIEYHSGGGITLQSELMSEFQEMLLKTQSFLSLFDSNLTLE